jgi:hypothetical protein
MKIMLMFAHFKASWGYFNLTKIWTSVVGIFTLLLGLFFYERNKRQDAEAQLENSETKQKDAVLGQHSEDIKNEINKDNLQAEAEKAKQSEQDLLDFLNKK